MIPHYLQEIQADGNKRQPFLLLLGLRLSPSQVFLIIHGLAVEQPTLFKAIDACFKAFMYLTCSTRSNVTQHGNFYKSFWQMVRGNKQLPLLYGLYVLTLNMFECIVTIKHQFCYF
ncbi:hypothetical protein HOLleu_00682 [Holothuria leucospilota]|uniref:Uncharacterized protein n=1 Tax=Holothuria leucospilota TaxID=206669 RepID=A0A9Q1HKE0_HOLLE|nr:hypothetical protein HOLleu_00682 [Holothuria leucospilota]